MTMGGHQVPGEGTGDDGFDEEGYDESQRAEILEVTRDGPSDGTILTDLNPDIGKATMTMMTTISIWSSTTRKRTISTIPMTRR